MFRRLKTFVLILIVEIRSEKNDWGNTHSLYDYYGEVILKIRKNLVFWIRIRKKIRIRIQVLNFK